MTTDLTRRLKQHQHNPPTRMRRDSELSKDNWYAMFKAEVLEIVNGTKAAAQRAEAIWIERLQTTGRRGYNSVEGGLAYSAKLQYLLRNGKIK